ncbi:MAG: NifB/NifX family molybdenum-iron cluster-binding protein [Candidatus Competibacteraceae bacterium]
MGLQRHLRLVPEHIEKPAIDSAVKVAFATTDRKHVDQHFGAAQTLAIYAVTPTDAVLLEVAQFSHPLQDGHEDKLAAKLAVLEGCAAVYCQAVGGSAIRQLLNRGVQPLRVEEGTVIEALLQALQMELQTQPGTWLTRSIERRGPAGNARFDRMEAEGWRE